MTGQMPRLHRRQWEQCRGSVLTSATLLSVPLVRDYALAFLELPAKVLGLELVTGPLAGLPDWTEHGGREQTDGLRFVHSVQRCQSCWFEPVPRTPCKMHTGLDTQHGEHRNTINQMKSYRRTSE